MKLRVIVVGASVSLGACAGVLGVDDLGYVTDAAVDGALDAPSAHGARDDGTLPASDGGDGSPEADRFAPPDAPVLDAPIPDVSTSFCDGGQHSLCDDFDRSGGAFVPPWTATMEISGGIAEIAARADALSRPNVFHSQVSAADQIAQLYRNDSIGGRGMRCDLRARVDARGSGEASATSLIISSAQGYYRIDVRLTGSQGDYIADYGAVDGGAASVQRTNFGSIGASTWVELSLEIAFGAGGYLKVSVDGNAVLTRIGIPFTELSAATQESFTLGLQPIGASPGTWSALFDNVVCDAL